LKVVLEEVNNVSWRNRTLKIMLESKRLEKQ
jgi:hypothetical protein